MERARSVNRPAHYKPALPIPQKREDQWRQVAEDDECAHEGSAGQKLGTSGRAQGMKPASAARERPSQIDAR